MAEEQKKNPFMSIAGTLGSGLMSGVSGGLTDSLFGKDPVDEAARMQNALYPGTTPFERLNGNGNTSGAGAAESASSKALTAQINQAKRTADLKGKEIKNAGSMNERTAQATEYAADKHLEAANVHAEVTRDTKLPMGEAANAFRPIGEAIRKGPDYLYDKKPSFNVTAPFSKKKPIVTSLGRPNNEVKKRTSHASDIGKVIKFKR